jgi:hypothetical protein
MARWAAVMLAAASVGSVGLAAAAPGNSGEVKPGKGCGDRNHIHYREADCKKPPR